MLGQCSRPLGHKKEEEEIYINIKYMYSFNRGTLFAGLFFFFNVVIFSMMSYKSILEPREKLDLYSLLQFANL